MNPDNTISETVSTNKPARERTMKNTKEETAEAKSAFNARIGSYFKYGIERRKFSGKLPSPKELATLAAALARAPFDNPEKLCATALKLWYASHETLALQQQCNEDCQRLEDDRKARPYPPAGQQWPMTLDALCKILWPGKKEEDYKPIIRAWLQSLPPGLMPVGMDYAKMKSDPIAEPWFCHLRNNILRWYPSWKGQTNSAGHSKAGKISWQDCDAKTQKEPLYQEYKAECVKRERKTSARGFKKWLTDRTESPDAKAERVVKKITLPS